MELSRAVMTSFRNLMDSHRPLLCNMLEQFISPIFIFKTSSRERDGERERKRERERRRDRQRETEKEREREIGGDKQTKSCEVKYRQGGGRRNTDRESEREERVK